MFVTNVVLANQILDRGFFYNLKEATYHANQQAKEKIWKLPNGSVFFGDVEVRVYNTDDYKNEYFLSFVDSCWNRTHVMWPTCCEDSIRNLPNALHSLVFFEPTRLYRGKRTFHQRWEAERVSFRTPEASHDNVGWFEFEELPIRLRDWDRFDPWIHS